MSDQIRRALLLSRQAAAYGGGFSFPTWGGAAAFNPMAYGASWGPPRATGSWLPQFSMPAPAASAPAAPAPSAPSAGGWNSLYNYRPVQQAAGGDYGLRRSWAFDAATDPSRLLAKRMEEEAARKAAEDAAMLEKEEASRRFQPVQQSGNNAEGSGPGEPGAGIGEAGAMGGFGDFGGGGGGGMAGAYGGRMTSKAARSALRVAHRAAGGQTENPQDAERKRREREELERKLREYAEAQQGMPRRELLRAAVSAIAAPSLMAGPSAAAVRQDSSPRPAEPMDDWQPQDEEPHDLQAPFQGRAEMPERAGTAEGRAPEPSAPPDTGDTFKRMLHIESRNSQFDSRGRPLISRAGAVGIGQILPNTAREMAKRLGVEFDLNRLHRDADYNKQLSEAYYGQLVGMFQDPHVAAAAYNAGPGRVKTAMAEAARHGRSYEDFLPRETQKYLAMLREPHADGGSVGGGDDGLHEREAGYFASGGAVEPPQRTVKAYKLFRTDRRQPGKLFPLFVNADREVPIGQWLAAEEGPMQGGKVKSRLGPLAYRPGWHAGDLPVATHIGGKSDPSLTKPDHRPDNHVWAEVEMPADVDWQEEAMRRARRTKAGEIDPKTAHITDQIPHGGHYRYKTNPNMTGNWLISGGLKVNRVLGDDEVKAINDAAGVADLPRRSAQADTDHPAASIPGVHVRAAEPAKASGGPVDDDHGEGIIGYHGSPHQFDQFDPAHIGSGEGAQAYGHGMYFAENEGVARGYRDTLSGKNVPARNYMRDGAVVPNLGDVWQSGFNAAKGVGGLHDDHAHAISSHIRDWVEAGRKPETFLRHNEVQDHLIPAYQAAADAWKGVTYKRNNGHLYQVRIKARPEHFLDWDKPLSEQPQRLRDALAKRDPDSYHPEGDDYDETERGHQTYQRLNDVLRAKHPSEVSDFLRGAGIRGIRYLDGNSRNQGQGTHNYVVFDPKHVEVMRRYADGGEVGKREGGAREYQDPPSSLIEDWQWRPLKDVQADLNLTEIPSHVQAFGRFMDETAARAASKGLTARDLIKAYTITRSSIQRESRTAAKVRAAGLVLPDHVTGAVRPEGAFGEWLHSPMGRRYLDAAERGDVDADAVRNAVQIMRPFGKAETDIPDSLIWAAQNLPGREKEVSDLVARGRDMASKPAEWRAMTKGVRGIGPAKAGFYASMLGRGDQPTLDARQIKLHTGLPTKEATRFLRRKEGQGSVDAVERLSARQAAMNLASPSDLQPYYQHLTHHTAWDKASDAVTTHEDVMNAMRHAATGGAITSHPLVDAMRRAGLPGLEGKAQRAGLRDGGLSPNDDVYRQAMEKILRPQADHLYDAAKRVSEGYKVGDLAYSGFKGHPVMPSGVTTKIGDIPGVAPKAPDEMSWGKFHNIAKGGTLFTLGGDRSNLGRLTHVNGKKLAWPVDLHAGTKYQQEPNPGVVWANDKNAAKALRGNILAAAERGPVYGAFTPMAPTAVDSSANMMDVLLSQIAGTKISKDAAKRFDDLLKQGVHMYREAPGSPDQKRKEQARAAEKMRDWPGIKAAEKARAFALNKMSGKERSALVKLMDAKMWLAEGFPSISTTRAAITDPDLLHVSGNMIGGNIVELDPREVDRGALAFEHSTYNTPTAGRFIGRVPFIERQAALPDFTQSRLTDPRYISKKTGESLMIHPYSPNPGGRAAYRGDTEMRQAVQPINNRMLESIEQDAEQKKTYGFKRGGTVEEALALTRKARRG